MLYKLKDTYALDYCICYKNARYTAFTLYCILTAFQESLNEGHRFACESILQERRLCANRFIEILIIKKYEKRCGQISTKGLRKIIKKFEETCSFEMKSGRGRKSIVSTAEEDVTTSLQEKTCKRVVY